LIAENAPILSLEQKPRASARSLLWRNRESAQRDGDAARRSWHAALAVAMLAAFMIAVALSSALVAGGLERTGARVELTHQVRDGLRRIVARVVEAESGHRGYLLTGEQFYLDPMRDAQAALPGETDALVKLVSDNREQSVRLDMLIRRVGEKMQAMAAIETIARDQSLDAARRTFDADIGLVRMRELAATVDAIIAESSTPCRATSKLTCGTIMKTRRSIRATA
jgi:CHASE3 domain sensor protein